MYEEPNEGTSFASTSIPQPIYTFDSSLIRIRKRKVRQFQCCVCVIFLMIIITAIVISLAFDINSPAEIPNANESFMNIPLEKWNFMVKSFNLSSYPEAVNAAKKDGLRHELIVDDMPEVPSDSASYKHQKIVYTSPKALNLSKDGFFNEYMTKFMVQKNETQFIFNESMKMCYNASNKMASTVNCSSIYRTFDGTCNNLKRFSFGVAYKPFLRILPPVYADGVSAPRASVSGAPLPSAREVSLTVHRPIYKEDDKFTIMLAVFGQFLDHDITSTALNKGKNGRTISCCDESNFNVPFGECFPVLYNTTTTNGSEVLQCMEFVRSLPASTGCLGPREQLNQVTSFIDASVVYGDQETAPTLRAFTGGKLRMYTAGNKELLPPSLDLLDGCNRDEEAAKGRYCFATGDGRANENLHLTSMHLLWAREHNRIADVLHQVNPHWDDERIYQEARKIVGAKLQHITYNEFLPILLGEKRMKEYDLMPLKEGFYNGYDDEVDASASNVFATAAFRFAHTLIPTVIRMHANSSDFVALRHLLMNPFKLYDDDGVDDVVGGALHTFIEANDPYFTNELKQHMFESARPEGENEERKACKLGLDLVSLNIQRGRDHGLAGYTKWQRRCGLRRAHDFHQLAEYIDDESLAHIASVYRRADDIDLYTGAISERPLADGFLGPTFTCLLLDQFYRLKRGDRFWYENAGQFSASQLGQLRRASLARIICDNADDVHALQPACMRRRTDDAGGNALVDCRQLPAMDLGAWRTHRVPLAGDDAGIRVRTRGGAQ